MAFNIIPSCVGEIQELSLIEEESVIRLFNFLTTEIPEIQNPFAFDVTKPLTVKVTRKIFNRFTKRELKSLLMPGSKLSILWGEGSRGGNGENNKGLLFEVELHDDLVQYKHHQMAGNFRNPDFVDEFSQEYKLDEATRIVVRSMGALNQSRPLIFEDGDVFLKQRNPDIGSTITDLDVIRNDEIVHISAKFGSSATLFNAGITSFFPPDEIQNGHIVNEYGNIIFDLFGIDNGRFCEVFDSYDPRGPKVKMKNPYDIDYTTDRIDLHKVQTLIKTGIGCGYHMVHKAGTKAGNIKHFTLTEEALHQGSWPYSVVVKYPKNNSKRISIGVETEKFDLTIIMRDSGGQTHYPQKLSSSYKMK
tara:strand:+ start:2569 stop:3651 length:1083 start_codon:yes stop_codon:yes gene_type:complete